MSRKKGETRQEYYARLSQMTKQERALEDLKRIKAYVYGFKRELTRADTHWLIEMAEKAIKGGDVE